MKESKRFVIAIYTITLIIGTAWAKHFFHGIDIAALGIAAGLVTAYLTAESWRKSEDIKNETK